jgi:hypothetical protein
MILDLDELGTGAARRLKSEKKKKCRLQNMVVRVARKNLNYRVMLLKN